jgi:omega-amidase
MKITIVQPSTIWEDKLANYFNIKNLLESSFGKTDMVVLPEMFSTGFSLNAAELAEEFNGKTLNWMSELSMMGNFAICGSFIVKSLDKYYNRFAFVLPRKKPLYYDKRHLFSLAKEDEIFSGGKTRRFINYLGFRCLPIICYDLRFPVWCRNKGDYDIMICVASWPAVRRDAWNTLLKARAIENQCFVIGVNRTGIDNEGLKYAGDSIVIDPQGKSLGKVSEYEEGTATVDISLSELQKFRKKFPVWRDSDDFLIKT